MIEAARRGTTRPNLMIERPALALAILLISPVAACGSSVEPDEARSTDSQTSGSTSDEDPSTSTASDTTAAASSGGSSSLPTTSTQTSTGPDTASGSESGSDTGSTGDATESCACVAQSGPLTIPGCDLDEVCDPIVVACSLPAPSSCTFDDFTVLDPTQLDCHRDAILSGQPGFLRWELPYVPDPGSAGQRGWVVLPGDGSARFWRESWGEGTYEVSAVDSAPLDNDATTNDCGDLVSTEETLQCLYSPRANEVTTCEEAYDFPFD